jgi:hypothetical protein
MSGILAGTTITVYTKKNLNTDELAAVLKAAFKNTGCQTCTSGGHFILREELDLPIDPALGARATIT